MRLDKRGADDQMENFTYFLPGVEEWSRPEGPRDAKIDQEKPASSMVSSWLGMVHPLSRAIKVYHIVLVYKMVVELTPCVSEEIS